MARPTLPDLRFLAIATGLTVSILAMANFSMWLWRYGMAAALDVDGGGGSTFGILLLLSSFGLIIGGPIVAVIRFWAPRSWVAVLVGLALFAAIGGKFNSSPILTFQHWLEGALLSLAFAGIVIATAAAMQRVWKSPSRS